MPCHIQIKTAHERRHGTDETLIYSYLTSQLQPLLESLKGSKVDAVTNQPAQRLQTMCVHLWADKLLSKIRI